MLYVKKKAFPITIVPLKMISVQSATASRNSESPPPMKRRSTSIHQIQLIFNLAAFDSVHVHFFCIIWHLDRRLGPVYGCFFYSQITVTRHVDPLLHI